MSRNLLLTSRKDDFTACDEAACCGSDDIPYAIPANDNFPGRIGILERYRGLLRYLLDSYSRLASAH